VLSQRLLSPYHYWTNTRI